MTRNKAGQNPPTGHSAKLPIHEATPETKDGPEGYSEDGSIRNSGDDKIKAGEQETMTIRLGDGRWEIPDIDRTITRWRKPESLRFGSPFAYSSYRDKHDFFKGLLAKSTRVLFDRVVAEASTLMMSISTDVPLTNDGRIGCFCFLEECESSSKNAGSSEASNANGSQVVLQCFGSNTNRFELSLFVDPTFAAIHGAYVTRNDIVGSIDSSDSSSLTSENIIADNILDVRRVRDSGTGNIDYFVVNKNLDRLSINGMDVNLPKIGGPLPDFAVLEIGRHTIFWWRTAAALRYMPGLKRKRESEDEDEEQKRSSKTSKKDGDSSPKRVSPNWDDIFCGRLAGCETRPRGVMPGITRDHPYHELPDIDALSDGDVILAIAAVWYGLYMKGFKFAFGDLLFFAMAPFSRLFGFRAVGELQPFVIPLILSEAIFELMPEAEDNVEEDPDPLLPFSAFQRGEERKHKENVRVADQAKAKDPGNKDKPTPSFSVQQAQRQNYVAGIGHFVLAIAELRPDGRVQIKIRDSLPLEDNKPYIRRAARNVVRLSGWLGDVWPQFVPEVWERVSRQSCGNTCGYHTVLNAWAYMFNLPLAGPGTPYPCDFYKDARRMMQCALRGQLDGLTIIAFMQVARYVQGDISAHLHQNQSQSLDSLDRLRKIRSVAMNESVLSEIIAQMLSAEENRKLAATHVQPSPSRAGNAIGGSSYPSAHIPPAPARSWQEKLDQGLARWKRLKQSRPRNKRKDPVQIGSVSNMAAEEVVAAIASIWEGLTRHTDKSKLPGSQVVAHNEFTYAGCDVFAPTGTGDSQVKGAGVVGGPKKEFIIPLLNLSESHFFLAVAKKLDPNKKQERGVCPVRVLIMDSRPETLSRDKMWCQCMSFIYSSGWLGVNAKGKRIRPHCELANVNFIPVPRQVGINACGLFVILNAWAYTLGIIVHDGFSRRGRTNDGDFLAEGLEIVNLALAGFMDSGTIQAFMNVHGYCIEQNFTNSIWAVTPVNAIGMNLEKLTRVMRRRRDAELLEEAKAKGVQYPDEMYQSCLEMGLTSRKNIWSALVLNSGDVQSAVNWWYNDRQDSPTSALSPRTPEDPNQEN